MLETAAIHSAAQTPATYKSDLPMEPQHITTMHDVVWRMV
jgi:hypothetical protein